MKGTNSMNSSAPYLCWERGSIAQSPPGPALFNPQCVCGAHLPSPDADPGLSWLNQVPQVADSANALHLWSVVWRVLLPRLVSGMPLRRLPT